MFWTSNFLGCFKLERPLLLSCPYFKNLSIRQCLCIQEIITISGDASERYQLFSFQNELEIKFEMCLAHRSLNKKNPVGWPHCFLHSMAYAISHLAQFLQMLTGSRRELSRATWRNYVTLILVSSEAFFLISSVFLLQRRYRLKLHELLCIKKMYITALVNHLHHGLSQINK